MYCDCCGCRNSVTLLISPTLELGPLMAAAAITGLSPVPQHGSFPLCPVSSCLRLEINYIFINFKIIIYDIPP